MPKVRPRPFALAGYLPLLLVLAGSSACVPWVVSYYAPESPLGVDVDPRCGWTNVTRKVNVTESVSLVLQTSPRDRVAFDFLYIRIADQSVVKLESDSILVRSGEFLQPITLKIQPASRGSVRTPVMSEVTGPGLLRAAVDDPTESRKPQEIVVQLPTVSVNSKVHELEPITYRLHRSLHVVAPCG